MDLESIVHILMVTAPQRRLKQTALTEKIARPFE
jgi:hypothetical protein